MKVPKNTLVDINKLKGLPKNKQVIVTTGSQGEEMSPVPHGLLHPQAGGDRRR